MYDDIVNTGAVQLQPGQPFFWNENEHYTGTLLPWNILEWQSHHTNAQTKIFRQLIKQILGWLSCDMICIFRPSLLRPSLHLNKCFLWCQLSNVLLCIHCCKFLILQQYNDTVIMMIIFCIQLRAKALGRCLAITADEWRWSLCSSTQPFSHDFHSAR